MFFVNCLLILVSDVSSFFWSLSPTCCLNIIYNIMNDISSYEFWTEIVYVGKKMTEFSFSVKLMPKLVCLANVIVLNSVFPLIQLLLCI